MEEKNLSRQAMSHERQLKNYISTFPDYMQKYFTENPSSSTLNTLYNYALDMNAFMQYMRRTERSLRHTESRDFPLSVFEHFTSYDAQSYLVTLELGQARNTVSRKYTSLVSFFKYLNVTGQIDNFPFLTVTRPKPTKGDINIYLSDKQISRVLNGTLKSTRYLVKNEDGTHASLPITTAVRFKKEKTAYRNYAILMAFTHTGINVSELIALNLNDVHFDEGYFSVVRKDGKRKAVYFDQKTADALRLYLNGDKLPEDLLRKYPDFRNISDFCRIYMAAADIERRAAREYSRDDDEFLGDIERIARWHRKRGREALQAAPGENALFISIRGTRMSVRMVEVMVREMVMTYLPDLPYGNKITPSRLRASYAANAVTAGEDPLWAARQMGVQKVELPDLVKTELVRQAKDRFTSRNLREDDKQ